MQPVKLLVQIGVGLFRIHKPDRLKCVYFFPVEMNVSANKVGIFLHDISDNSLVGKLGVLFPQAEHDFCSRLKPLDLLQGVLSRTITLGRTGLEDVCQVMQEENIKLRDKLTEGEEFSYDNQALISPHQYTSDTSDTFASQNETKTHLSKDTQDPDLY